MLKNLLACMVLAFFATNAVAASLDGEAAPVEIAQTTPDVYIGAADSWTYTGVEVPAGGSVSIVASGRWTANPMTGLYGQDGYQRATGKPGYAKHDAYEGALICRVRSYVFQAGTNMETGPFPNGGSLECVINDDLRQIYGLGLTDNTGGLWLTITVD